MIILLTTLFCATLGNTQQQPSTFFNPIEKPEDLYRVTGNVLRVDDFYYLAYLYREDYVEVKKSPVLTNFSVQSHKVAIGKQLVSCQLVEINETVYLYYTDACTLFGYEISYNWRHRRVWKLELLDYPMLTPKCRMFGEMNDFQVMLHNNKLYLLSVQMNKTTWEVGIFIKPILHPLIIGNHDWAPLRMARASGTCADQRFCTISTPRVTYFNGTTFVVFSVTTTKLSHLSYVSIPSTLDPLNVTNWSEAPGNGSVFEENAAEDVFQIYGASFTTSPDRTETWMVYYAYARNNDTSVNQYTARAQKISWNSDTGNPEFPVPLGLSHPQPVPSGQA